MLLLSLQFYRLTDHTMKKLSALVLALGFLFFLGCAKTTPTTINDASWTVTTALDIPDKNIPERQTYTNKVDGFTLQFPGDRTFQEKVYWASVMFSSPISENDKIKENVSVMKKPLDKASTLEEYYVITKEWFAIMSGYAEMENTTIQVNDLDAKKIVFKWSLQDTQLQFEEIFLIKDKFVYTITYTATEATFDDYIQKVNEMIATLEIK